MTAKLSSGRRRTAPGTRCMNTPDTSRQVRSCSCVSCFITFVFSISIYHIICYILYVSVKLQCVFSLAVNSVCWGPYEFGLILACGSSDGAISLLTFTGDQQWDVKKISNAHTVSLESVVCLRDSVQVYNVLSL